VRRTQLSFTLETQPSFVTMGRHRLDSTPEGGKGCAKIRQSYKRSKKKEFSVHTTKAHGKQHFVTVVFPKLIYCFKNVYIELQGPAWLVSNLATTDAACSAWGLNLCNKQNHQ